MESKMLAGYKTYIVAVIAAITALGAWLAGDITIGAAGQAILTSLLGATIRSGITTETNK